MISRASLAAVPTGTVDPVEGGELCLDAFDQVVTARPRLPRAWSAVQNGEVENTAATG